ncbi:uncharacterized protein VTP21DRAFT_6586 [Calcarisporiella thermophila]|uniref:uncharacterized protein n=1 Tax=Calcarisporiella thermophila TaxID=911321 RepID=UPI003742F154
MEPRHRKAKRRERSPSPDKASVISESSSDVQSKRRRLFDSEPVLWSLDDDLGDLENLLDDVDDLFATLPSECIGEGPARVSTFQPLLSDNTLTWEEAWKEDSGLDFNIDRAGTWSPESRLYALSSPFPLTDPGTPFQTSLGLIEEAEGAQDEKEDRANMTLPIEDESKPDG